MLDTIYNTFYNLFFAETEIFTELNTQLCYMLSIATIAAVTGCVIAVIWYAFRSIFDLITFKK